MLVHEMDHNRTTHFGLEDYIEMAEYYALLSPPLVKTVHNTVTSVFKKLTSPISFVSLKIDKKYVCLLNGQTQCISSHNS